MELPERAERILSRQRDLITVQQLRAIGVDKHLTNQLVMSGALLAVRRGLYGARHPGSFEDRVMAACLHQSTPVASALTAAHLWGLWQEPERLEVSIRYPRKATVGTAAVHRSRDLTATDRTTLDGLPVTTPARTLVDLGRVLPPLQVERVLDHAVATGLTSRQRVLQLRIRVGARGRNGAGVMGALLDQLPACAEQADSGPEVAVLRLIERHSLPTPELQTWVRAGGRRFRIDLAYPDHLVAIEYDGAEFHGSQEQKTADTRRQEALEARGWTFVRITADDLTWNRASSTVARIRRALRGCDVSRRPLAHASRDL